MSLVRVTTLIAVILGAGAVLNASRSADLAGSMRMTAAEFTSERDEAAMVDHDVLHFGLARAWLDQAGALV